ncbi:hypothetical protein FO014_09965 [Serratia rhizosphaerae]|uniref:Uncharacterized protein n=1 Tax=Serratia rhizosphaerae TaxID=2597702 RepID=A0ABX6GLS6_9GAMM|nr:hypothetical protein FO014_09965 [Serratia rhizosphaerae]
MRTAFHGLSLPRCRRTRRRRGKFQGRPATIPAWEIAIGTTDHSANKARDPPLPHRLDPFYPQTPACGDLFHKIRSFTALCCLSGRSFYIGNRLYPVIHPRILRFIVRIARGSLRFNPESV